MYEREKSAFHDLGKAIGNLSRDLVTTLRPHLTAIGNSVRQIMKQLEDEYRRQGAPYGDTPAGFERWLDEWLIMMKHIRALDDAELKIDRDRRWRELEIRIVGKLKENISGD